MAPARARALLVLLAVAACAKREIVASEEVGAFRVDSDPKRKILRTSAPPLESKWFVDGNVVTGTLAWTRACGTGLVRERVKRKRTVEVADVPANLGWIVASAGMITGSGALFAGTWDGSVTARASAVPPALVLGIGGAFAGAAAMAALFAGTDDSSYAGDVERKDEVSVAPGAVSCGDAEALARAKFALQLPGAARLHGTSFGANVGFVLPIGGDASPRAACVVETPRDSLLESGERVAEIDLSSYLAFRENPPAAPPFGGRFITEGVSIARACAPREAIEVCNGVDDDCDGFYDVGCGYRAGSLQWTLSWSSHVKEDLQLVVTGPDDVAVSRAARRGGASGLAMDAACESTNGAACERRLENIYLPVAATPAEGTYRAEISLAAPRHDASAQDVRAMFAWRASGRAFRGEVALQLRRAWRATLLFALGPDRDNDGVIDREDACPDERGSFFTPPPRRGCPRER